MLRLEKGEEPMVYTRAFGGDAALAAEAAAGGGGPSLDGRMDADDLAVRDMTDWVLGHQVCAGARARVCVTVCLCVRVRARACVCCGCVCVC